MKGEKARSPWGHHLRGLWAVQRGLGLEAHSPAGWVGAAPLIEPAPAPPRGQASLERGRGENSAPLPASVWSVSFLSAGSTEDLWGVTLRAGWPWDRLGIHCCPTGPCSETSKHQTMAMEAAWAPLPAASTAAGLDTGQQVGVGRRRRRPPPNAGPTCASSPGPHQPEEAPLVLRAAPAPLKSPPCPAPAPPQI